MWTKTLRERRVAVIGWGVGLALLLALVFAVYASTVATNREATAGAAQLARTLRFFGEPVAVDTATGFVTWRVLGIVPVILSVWMVIAGAQLVRGEEDRGSMDVLLSTPRSRVSLLAGKLVGMVVALFIVGALTAGGTILGEALADATVDPGGALLAALNVVLVSLVFGLLALLLSQLLPRAGAAAGLAGALMALSYLLDGTARVVTELTWIQRVSPFFYFSLSKPLIASYGANAGALAVLGGLCLIFAIASLALFRVRDIGGVAWRWRNRPGGTGWSAAVYLANADRERSLRGVWQRALWAQAPAMIWWTVGLSAYAAWMTGIVRGIADTVNSLIASMPTFQALLGGMDSGITTAILSGMLFTFLPVVLALFAMLQAGAAVRELDRGRMELVLSTPLPRHRVLLQQFAALAIALVLTPLAIGLAVMVSAATAGIGLEGGQLLVAIAGILPLELFAAALVYLIGVRASAGTATAAVGALIAASFLAEFLNPLLDLPQWLVALSVFHHYGSPLVEDVRWLSWLMVTGIAAVFLSSSALLFDRGDVRRGQ